MYGPSYVFRSVFRSVWMVSHNVYLNANIATVRSGEQTTRERWHGTQAVQDQSWHGFDQWGGTAWEQATAWEPTQTAWEPTQVAWQPTQAVPWEPTQPCDAAWESTQEHHDVGAPHPPPGEIDKAICVSRMSTPEYTFKCIINSLMCQANVHTPPKDWKASKKNKLTTG